MQAEGFSPSAGGRKCLGIIKEFFPQATKVAFVPRAEGFSPAAGGRKCLLLTENQPSLTRLRYLT